jgi:hypothetical protein
VRIGLTELPAAEGDRPFPITIAGDTKDEVALLKPQGKVFELGRESAAALQDDSLRERTLDWLTRAQELQGERNRVIQSIAVFDHPGWYGLHLKSRTLVPTQEVLDLADEARRHADEGNYMGLFDWPPALGHQPAN